MNWAIVLHFYQPTDQQKEVVENVVKTAYRPILSLIDQYPAARASININACLTEQLHNFDFDDILHALRKLALKGKIEFIASAKNHALLPLIPEYEIAWQIKQGLTVNQQILGEAYKPSGFFPTELAVSHKVAKVVRQQGFTYILADEISFDGRLGDRKQKQKGWTKLSTIAGTKGLVTFFSNRFICDLIRGTADLEVSRFEKHWKRMSRPDRGDDGSYLVSVHDAEAFGHHHASRHEILKWTFEQAEDGKISVVKLKDLYEAVKKKEETELFKGTWETSPHDIREGAPFPLWYHPHNPLHQVQWNLAWRAIESLNQARKRGEKIEGDTFRWARRHLSSGLHSCYFWWGSCRPWWNPDMVVKGATELTKVIRTLDTLKPEEKSEAEDQYVKIIHMVWQWHWGGEAQRRIDEFESKSSP